MAYQIKFSNQAVKFFRKLPMEIQKRVKSKFREISKDPNRYLEHYAGNYHKIRIDGLRVLVDIDNNTKIIWVRVLDKRGRIYK